MLDPAPLLQPLRASRRPTIELRVSFARACESVGIELFETSESGHALSWLYRVIANSSGEPVTVVAGSARLMPKLSQHNNTAVAASTSVATSACTAHALIPTVPAAVHGRRLRTEPGKRAEKTSAWCVGGEGCHCTTESASFRLTVNGSRNVPDLSVVEKQSRSPHDYFWRPPSTATAREGVPGAAADCLDACFCLPDLVSASTMAPSSNTPPGHLGPLARGALTADPGGGLLAALQDSQRRSLLLCRKPPSHPCSSVRRGR